MQSSSTFWNKEYKNPKHLKLSDEPSADLVIFEAWMEKTMGKGIFKHLTLLDVGCGNGRNSLYLANKYGMKGYGFDIAGEAIMQAKKLNPKGSGIIYAIGDIAEPLPIKDGSIGLVLDLMTSHFLDEAGRERYMQELVRILEPRGMVLWKTFLKDEDIHSTDLLKNYGTTEKNSYIHPKIGVQEHVFSEDEFRDYVEPYFTVESIKRSHGHRTDDGRKGKRRYLVAYLSKKD